MDGGIIESMLIGSAIGGGTSLLTGNDPLRGALMGGLTGGITGGIMPGSATTPLSTGANALDASGLSATAAMEGTGTGLLPGAGSMGFQSTGSMGFTAPGVTSAAANSGLDLANYTSPLSAGAGSATMDLSNYTSPLQDMASQGIAGSIGGMPTQLSAAGQAAAQSSPEFLKDPLGWWKSLSKTEKMLYGGGAGLGLMMLSDRNRYGIPKQTPYSGPLSKFHYDPSTFTPTIPNPSSFYPQFSDGGITTLGGGNIAVGGDPRRNPAPISEDNTSSDGWQSRSDPFTRMADGGIASLGSYSDGGRLLKGPGDGMSDNIPATIGHKQPARLAEGEFVVPADVVSHLGNGSTDAGAKQLYAMMDKVRRARTGRVAQGREINPRKYMPA